MPTFTCQFDHLLIVGGGEVAADIVSYAHELGIDATVMTSPRLSEDRLANGLRLIDVASAVDFRIIVTPSLADCRAELTSLATSARTLVVSFGSPFILSQWFLDLFDGKVLNAHAAPLPEWRGGGGFSWRIMADDRRGSLTFHVVTPGIDDGPILHQSSYTVSEHCRYPQDWDAEKVRYEAPELRSVLDRLRGGETFVLRQQDETKSTYFPRLSCDLHGGIDWTLSAEAVARFILAFSHPYPGAWTFLGEERVAVMDAYPADCGPTHPFMAGLVLRKQDGCILVCCGEGALTIRLTDLRCKSEPRLGDRLWTSAEHLDKAKATRVHYSPSGMRVG